MASQPNPAAECFTGFRTGFWFHLLVMLMIGTPLLAIGCKPNKRYDLI